MGHPEVPTTGRPKTCTGGVCLNAQFTTPNTPRKTTRSQDLYLAQGKPTAPDTKYSKARVKPSGKCRWKDDQKTTWQRYGKNIIYQDLSKIDFTAVPKWKVVLPAKLNTDFRGAITVITI